MNNITIYLTMEEASEMNSSLNELIKNPHNNHAHISSSDYGKEVTVCIYDKNNLTEFDQRSVDLIENDQ